MTGTNDANDDDQDGTARLQAEAVTGEGALDTLIARGNLTTLPLLSPPKSPIARAILKPGATLGICIGSTLAPGADRGTA
jgi:hypothetical protein